MSWRLFPTQRPTLSKTSLDLLLIFGLMLLFYANPLLDRAKMSYGGDAMSLFLPAHVHYREAIFNGFLPLWSSYTWLGAPFLATLQGAVLYPPQLLSLFFKTPAVGQNFYVFLSLLWLAYGAYVFGLRALELQRMASILMAVVLGCSGFVGGHLDNVNQIAAISWIPWILTEALVLLRSPRVGYAMLFAITFCCQILAGHPQYVVFTLAYLLGLVGCYSVYFYHRRRAEDPPTWHGAALIGGAVVVGLGLAAAQILPSGELSALSSRSFDPPDRRFVDSLPPKYLVTLFVPDAYGNPATGLHQAFDPAAKAEFNCNEFMCYVGVVTLALAVLGSCVLIHEFIVRAFVVMALLSLLMAFGRYAAHGLFYQFVMMWFPGEQGFRAPARFLMFFVVSMSVLAAFGFNQVTHFLSERRRVPRIAVAVCGSLVIALLYVDLALFSSRQTFRHSDTADVLEEQGRCLEVLRADPGEHRVFRLAREVPYFYGIHESYSWLAERRVAARLEVERVQPNLHRVWDVQGLAGYEEGLLPTLAYRAFIGHDMPRHRMGRFTRNLYVVPSPDTQLLGLLNVKYVLSDRPLGNPRLRLLASEVFEPTTHAETMAKQFMDDPKGDGFLEPECFQEMLYENLDFLPRLQWGAPLRRYFTPEGLRVADHSPEGMVSMDLAEPNYAYRLLRDEATSAPLPVLLGREEGLAVGRPAASPDAYSFVKKAEESGEVILLESSYPGWVCRWPGGETPMESLNAGMMHCTVPPGPTQLEIRFEPFSFRLGLFVSCCFALLLCSFLCFIRQPVRTLFPKGSNRSD
jgi:hypothetical protein